MATVTPLQNPKKNTDDSKTLQEATQHLRKTDGPSIFVGHLSEPSTILNIPVGRLCTFKIESCYHSSVAKGEDTETLVFDTHYNLRGDRLPMFENDAVDLVPQHHIVRFQYNISNGQASYLLACKADEFKFYVSSLREHIISTQTRPHPFAVHLILLYKAVLGRSSNLEAFLRRLLLLEDHFIFKETKVTFETGDETEKQLQQLHSLFQDFIIVQNYNKRGLTNVKCMLRDLERLQKMQSSSKDAFPVDHYLHERISDGLLCLQDLCEDRATRLVSRIQRVQNLISLTYNLMANRDSMTSQTIATESTNIAHEARQDSTAMKTIAILTMFFLPATFISSLFGSNFFSMNTEEKGNPLVVSDLWWLYLVSAIPLTLMTLACWWIFLKWRKRRQVKRQRSNEKVKS